MDWERKLREQYAIGVRSEWLEQVLGQLRQAHPDLATWPEVQVLEKIFTSFLFCDLNQAGTALLPPNVKEMHKQVLAGKFVLQIDEVVNMAAAARERYTDQTSNRCMKFALTDGCQQVVGVEHSHLPTITWDCPAGSKVILHNVPIRRGLLLLGPDNTALLGGQVERLEAARQRAVAAWTRPVVGRPGNAGERDIFGEARAAAWAPGPHPGPAAPAAAAGAPGQGPAGRNVGAAGPAGAAAPGAVGAPAQQQQPQQQPWGNGHPQQQPHAQRQQQHQQPQQQPNGWGAPPPQQQPNQHNQHQHPQQQPLPHNGAGAGSQGWQGPPGNSQQWQQQQHPQPTLPRGLTPPTQQMPTQPPGGLFRTDAGGAAGQPGAASSHGNGAAAAAAGGSGWLGPAQSQGRDGSGGWNAGDAGGGGGSNGRGVDAPVVLLTSSSETASGRSNSHISLDASGPLMQHPPGPLQPQNQQQQAQQQAPSGLQRLGSVNSGALGGSAIRQPGPPPPAALAAAANAAGPTSSNGLLPPSGPRGAAVAAAQRPALPSPSVTSSGSAAAAGMAAGRKPALPLARSSPTPSGYMGGGSRGMGPSPRVTAAGGRSQLGTAANDGGGGGAVLPDGPDVEMVDLASLDDDDDAGIGGSGAAQGSSGGASTGHGGPRIDPWVRTHSGKSRLEPPFDPPGGVEKRPRLLSRLPTSEYDSARGFSGAAAHGRAVDDDGSGGLPGRSAAALAASAAPARQLEGPDVQESAAAATNLAAAGPLQAQEQGQEQQHLEEQHPEEGFGFVADEIEDYPFAEYDDPDPPAAAVDADDQPPHEHHQGWEEEVPPDAADPMALDHNYGPNAAAPDPLEPPHPDLDQDPCAADPDAGSSHAAHATATATVGGSETSFHAGTVQLYQVEELLAAAAGGAPAAAALGFPLTLDVYGLFHQLDGDVALVEDGTAIVAARLTSEALEPQLAGVVPPEGYVAEHVGLEDIQLMAESSDPEIQLYGQELATRLMDYIRDFHGTMRLKYPGPPPEQPLIIRLEDEGGGDEGGGGGAGGAPRGGPPGGNAGGNGGCGMYEGYLRDIKVLGAGDGQQGMEGQE